MAEGLRKVNLAALGLTVRAAMKGWRNISGQALKRVKKSSGSRGFVEVEVLLKDGRRDQVRIDVPPGHPKRELTWDDLRAKFMDCAKQAPRISSASAEAAFADIRNLAALNDVGVITRRLQ